MFIQPLCRWDHIDLLVGDDGLPFRFRLALCSATAEIEEAVLGRDVERETEEVERQADEHEGRVDRFIWVLGETRIAQPASDVG